MPFDQVLEGRAAIGARVVGQKLVVEPIRRDLSRIEQSDLICHSKTGWTEKRLSAATAVNEAICTAVNATRRRVGVRR